MEYKKFDLGNYNLYVLVTDRFKTIDLKINIRIDNKKEYDKYIPMLWRMLINTSSKYNSIKEINEAAVDIYDPYYGIRVYNSGKEDVLSLSATFVNEKYTEEGMNEKNIKFLADFIFNPKIVNNGFDEEMFEAKKEKLIDYYMSTKDYPREYAESRFHEEMKVFDYEEYSLGEVTELTKSLTRFELYDFYKKTINEGKLDIFVSGNVDPIKIKNIFEKNIKFRGKDHKVGNHIINQKEYNKKPKLIIDNSSNVQSNLIIGCKCIDITDFERKYVSLLYSWILGGGMNSLLNQTVREKNSLCYYIYTNRGSLLGTLKICAGINGSDFEKTYDLIKSEMKNIEDGNFPLSLFDSVKNTYYNSLIAIEDNQNNLLESFISEVYGISDDIMTRRKMMEKVTMDDIKMFAKKVHIDIVYLLKGDMS